MKEIEVKILNINKKEIESKLLKLGAKKIFNGEIIAIYFAKEENTKQTIRLRRLGNRAYLTFKKPISNKLAKIREEYEVEVSDFEESKKILLAIGLKQYLTIKKHRTSYKLKDIEFEIDKYYSDNSFIPEFLEIEAKTIDLIYKYAELLGFKKEDCKPYSIKELVEYYK